MDSRLIDRAVERGIITPAQRDAILALPSEREEPAPGAAPETEAREGFNAVTIAYMLGTGIVLFGFGWFLVDRWRALGPGGVLAVATLYGALFLGVSVWLDRRGYSLAAAFGNVLAVGMTPIIAWAVLELTGLWPEGQQYCRNAFLWECTGKWIALDLITIAAALIALRWRPHPLLMHPIAIALLFMTAHVIITLESYGFGRFARGWLLVIGASLLLVLAWWIDRQGEDASRRGDYGFWFWFAGLALALFAMGSLWDYDDALRHLLAPVAIAGFAIAVLLRRRLLLAFGFIAAAWYLGYLVVDLFRDVVALPILLATVGLAIILLAVWAQRAYPRLIARADAAQGGRKRLPGGPLVLLAPAALAMLMLVPARARDVQYDRENLQRQRVWAAQAARQRREYQRQRAADSTAAAAGDTIAARRFEEMRRNDRRNPPPRTRVR